MRFSGFDCFGAAGIETPPRLLLGLYLPGRSSLGPVRLFLLNLTILRRPVSRKHKQCNFHSIFMSLKIFDDLYSDTQTDLYIEIILIKHKFKEVKFYQGALNLTELLNSPSTGMVGGMVHSFTYSE